jgi:electron transport complex protein RnfG
MTCKRAALVDAPQLGKGPHRLFIARKGDKPVGAVMEATAPDGYSGAIQLLVAAISPAPYWVPA